VDLSNDATKAGLAHALVDDEGAVVGGRDVGEGAGGACVDWDALPLAKGALAGSVAEAARDACLPVEGKFVVVVVAVLELWLAL
jgi:hypothetical protein